VERIRNQILVRLNRDAGDPETMAQLELFKTIFAGHPYGHPLRGTPESVAAISVDDLRAFLESAVARDNLKIAVVGNITAAELAPALDDIFAGLPATTGPADIPLAAIPSQGRTIVVARDQPQSVAVFGWPGIGRDDPDFYAAYVMNYILGGGGFSSRLTEEVREKRGLAYGVSTFLAPYDYGAAFLGSVATENARVAQSLEIVKSEIARMASEGVTDAELDNARTYLTGSFLLRFDSNSSIANELLGYQMTGRGIDFINTRNGLIEAVTDNDIARVAKRLLDPSTVTVVVVGKPENLLPEPPG
jgi:zinc protease